MPPAQVWTTGIAWPGAVERAATRAEAAGFDGLAVVDSQNLAGDPWVGLALAARETDRLRLGTAVTNPVTRHPAVTASAAVTLQVAAASNCGFIIEYSLGANPMIHDLVEESFPVQDGYIEIPDRSGLGITPDLAFLDRHTVREAGGA